MIKYYELAFQCAPSNLVYLPKCFICHNKQKKIIRVLEKRRKRTPSFIYIDYEQSLCCFLPVFRARSDGRVERDTRNNIIGLEFMTQEHDSETKRNIVAINVIFWID